MNLMKRYLTEPEQRALLTAAKAVADPLAQRDYHWLRVLIETGMRVGEFAQVTVAQAEEALRGGEWLAIPAHQRKGGKKGHEYRLTEPVRQSLRALLMLARSEAADWPSTARVPLVWGRDGTALSVRSYQSRLKLWLAEAGLPGHVSIHWLRHTRGMNVLRRCRGENPLKVVQLALGHDAISSTGVYLTMSREELAEQLDQVAGGHVGKAQARRRAAAGVAA